MTSIVVLGACSSGDSGEPPAAVKATLEKAAGAEELYSTLYGSFTDDTAALASAGDFAVPEGVQLSATLTGDGYCVEADDGSGPWHLARNLPVAAEGPC